MKSCRLQAHFWTVKTLGQVKHYTGNLLTIYILQVNLHTGRSEKAFIEFMVIMHLE